MMHYQEPCQNILINGSLLEDSVSKSLFVNLSEVIVHPQYWLLYLTSYNTLVRLMF